MFSVLFKSDKMERFAFLVDKFDDWFNDGTNYGYDWWPTLETVSVRRKELVNSLKRNGTRLSNRSCAAVIDFIRQVKVRHTFFFHRSNP